LQAASASIIKVQRNDFFQQIAGYLLSRVYPASALLLVYFLWFLMLITVVFNWLNYEFISVCGFQLYSI